ncbi:MAG TPA: hypothetical protein PK819_05680 [Thermomicrobiales bacterium]|nr:hypothetical protein [Thermomicrobiales bacterium]
MVLQVSIQVKELVEAIQVSASYETTDDLLLDALTRLQQELRKQEDLEHVRLGFAQLERGEWVYFDPADSELRLARARERATRGDTPAPHVCP